MVILVRHAVLLCGCFLLLINAASAEEKPATRQEAVARGLAIVQKAAANYPKRRECFSCHHQTLPLLAMTSAGAGGEQINKDLLREQGEFTRESFAGRLTNLKEGTGIGGKAMTVAYGLWTLKLAD